MKKHDVQMIDFEGSKMILTVGRVCTPEELAAAFERAEVAPMALNETQKS